jgi:hypothetical protein
MGDAAEALTLCDDVLKHDMRSYGEEHPNTAYSWHAVGAIHGVLGHTEQQQYHVQRALTVRRLTYGDTANITLITELADCAVPSPDSTGQHERLDLERLPDVERIHKTLKSGSLPGVVAGGVLALFYAAAGRDADAERLSGHAVEEEIRLGIGPLALNVTEAGKAECAALAQARRDGDTEREAVVQGKLLRLARLRVSRRTW